MGVGRWSSGLGFGDRFDSKDIVGEVVRDTDRQSDEGLTSLDPQVRQ